MSNSVRRNGIRPSARLLAACLLAVGLTAVGLPQAAHSAPTQAAAAKPQQDFATADAAAAALAKAVEAGDLPALRAILGPGSDKLVSSGDSVADANGRKSFVDSYTASHALVADGDAKMILTIGPNAWPMPIPLVKIGNVWRFDGASGARAIVDRRIGRNELLTIRTLLAGVQAQQDYFDRVKRGGGTGAYAQRLISTPDTQDGLYWDVAQGDPPSPLGPLVEQAQDEGYPGATMPNGKPVPYHGYFFKILKAQGPHAPGGAKNYVSNGQMTEGFAFVAWPAEYENSGVVTFVVDQDGVVFQKDLGATTTKTVAAMTRFDPDFSWARIDIKD